MDLDPAVCAGMAFGAPRVAQTALVELHHLLIGQGFRQGSQDDPTIVLEEQDAKPTDTGAVIGSRPAPAEPVARSAKLRGMTPSDRGAALALLARLLIEAAGRRSDGA